MTEPHKWLDFAREDLAMAKMALKQGIANQACFHAQQGVEKALKGFLRTKQTSIPKTHALEELLELCRRRDPTFLKLQEACIILDQYYIPTRYPDALPGSSSEGLPTEKHAKKAVRLFQEAFVWIQKKMVRSK